MNIKSYQKLIILTLAIITPGLSHGGTVLYKFALQINEI